METMRLSGKRINMDVQLAPTYRTPRVGARKSIVARLVRATMAIICLLSTSVALGVSSTEAAASAPGDELVKVARDITQEAHCTLSYNGQAAACPAGSVVADFIVTKSEAIAAGEAYVAPTNDSAADIAALHRLMKDVGQQAQAKEQAARRSPIMPARSCGYNQVASYSYDTGFPGNPGIGVDVYYDVTYYNGVCNSVGVNSAYTYFTRQTGNAWLDYTTFYATTWDPGCPTNLPHSSPYSPPMYGTTGNMFDDGVENGCNFWNGRTHSSIPLY